MSLLARKPRPLKRDATSLRDDRLFIVACDDTYAPKQYLEMFRLSRVQIHVIATEDGTSAAPHVLERLIAASVSAENDDERWMLLDVDHCTQLNHRASYIKAISDACQRGIQVALSNPSFELWLLLHHIEETGVRSLLSAREVESRLREVIGEYNKTKLNPAHFPLSTVATACERAARLGEGVGGGHNPDGNKTDVHLLIRSIVSKALPSQLPEVLRGLLSDRA